ncbi:MAG: ParB N-terminal domain-containing protein [Nitrospira sp.]|nr:MAG: ParB N-terminal domain-containing protein [Nitrospira sp.]
MNTTRWYAAFQEFQGKKIAPLSPEEAALRRLPIHDVRTVEALFQPRQLEEGTAQSGQHLEELKRALQARSRLDPITVFKIGGEWVCIDGHHRLEAYRQAGRKRLTHIPVKIFIGSLEEALCFSIAANAPDKLNLSRADKYEAAWRLVLLGRFSASQISRTSTVSERTVHNMRNNLQRLRHEYPALKGEEWTWQNVKEVFRGVGSEYGEHWEETKAKEIANELARRFHGVPAKRPRVFAKALYQYDPLTAQAICQELTVLCRNHQNTAEENPDF